MNKANEFLESLESSDKDKGVTTRLEPDILTVVKKWKRGRTIKDTVRNLIEVADEHLTRLQSQSSETGR